jgi:hypothetical protein
MLRSSAPALEHPSQGMSTTYALARKRRIDRRSAIECTTPTIECNRAPVNNVAASLNLEIGLGFVL